jgi:hypothetical protein
MDYWLVLVIAGLTSTLYALALSTPLGQRLTLAKTHYTVIFGVGMTIGFIALVDLEAAKMLLTFFVVTGFPIVIRSEVLDYQERQRMIKNMTGGGNDAP